MCCSGLIALVIFIVLSSNGLVSNNVYHFYTASNLLEGVMVINVLCMFSVFHFLALLRLSFGKLLIFS